VGPSRKGFGWGLGPRALAVNTEKNRKIGTANCAPPQGQPIFSTNEYASRGFGWMRRGKFFLLCNSVILFILEFLKIKEKKKVFDFTPRRVLYRDFFTIWLPNYDASQGFRTRKLAAFGEFAVELHPRKKKKIIKKFMVQDID